jgi:2'-5' RNA ligase
VPVTMATGPQKPGFSPRHTAPYETIDGGMQSVSGREGSLMGHSVLAVPVPALDTVIKERTAWYDASFVSTDPSFIHAHITVLAPWASKPTADDLAHVERIAQEAAPFDITLSRIGEFPDGVIYLRPEPDCQLSELASRLATAFPQFPPYRGLYDNVTPHLTLDRRSATVTPATVRASVGHLLPLAVTVDSIDLQWWANHGCRRLHTWQLGGRADALGRNASEAT